ncbi:FAD binding domain-containing protein [Dactylonectria estremocensis]|uniref:FAD binding domain-containing protein n=1 Tax=Dactylonectria estremocensis TaxID=1079267 RepID=A0A9P9EG01_9HYPO|nr:FAD binding domain-containing protein [Dactylonectria estremocensis]
MASTTSRGPRQVDDTIPIAQSNRTEFDFGDFDHSSIPLEKEEWPVIVIGSSMVGMTLGVILGSHGIKSVSFDRHPSTAIHPRAALFLLRSVEIYRQLGLEDHLRKNSALNFDLDAGMVVVEKLVGGKTLMNLQQSDPAQVAKVTPSQRLWLTQNMFEPLLRESAKAFGAIQEFSEAVVHYEEQKDGVVVVVQNVQSKKLRKLKAKYLVSCDGNRSATRRKEDIEWNGPGVIGQNISINFKADLTPYLGTRAKHGVTYISNSKIDAGFRLESEGKGGFMIVSRAGEKKDFAPDSVSERDAKQYFYDATGIEDQVDIEVESISYWSVAGFNAERFSSTRGRVFIAGDAAHVMPPTGGMGGNTGVQDVHNLAWKLAYTLRGKAAPSLLDTYNSERQTAAGFTMRQAFSRLQKRVLRTTPDEPELPDIVCELGYRYPTGASLHDQEVASSKSLYEDPFSPLAIAGSRFPHVIITDTTAPDRKLSTLDLIKTNFVLFATEPSSPWIDAAKNMALSVDTHGLNESSSPLRDEDGSLRSVARISEGEALLVRPDGFIAWKAKVVVEGHQEALKSALRQILGL